MTRVPSRRPLLGSTAAAPSGDRFKLDRVLREIVWSSGRPVVRALFPPLWGEEIERVGIRLGAETKAIGLDDNTTTGAATPVERLA